MSKKFEFFERFIFFHLPNCLLHNIGKTKFYISIADRLLTNKQIPRCARNDPLYKCEREKRKAACRLSFFIIIQTDAVISNIVRNPQLFGSNFFVSFDELPTAQLSNCP